MNRTHAKILTAAAAVLLLTVSCYWVPEEEDTASISLDFGGITAQANISSGSDTARVYLLAEKGKAQGLFPLDGDNEFADVDLGSDRELTIEDVSPGYEYRVLISFGEDNGSWFEVTEYAESDPVTVSPGAATEVTVDVEESPFVYPGGAATGLNGKDLNGVAFSGSAFVSDAVRLFDWDNGDDADPSNDALSTGDALGAAINGVSRGQAHAILANTSAGIFYGDDLGEIESQQSEYQGNVTLSAQFADDVVFQGPGTIGAVGDLNTNTLSDWAVVDIGDVVAGDPIRDYSLEADGTERAAVVSALGSFTVDADDFNGVNEDSTWDDISALLTFFDNEFSSRILSVGFDGNTLYVGTDDGIYNRNTGTGPLFGSGSTIVTDIAAGGTNTAFLGPYYLFLDDGTRIPFAAGFPGNPTDLTWGSGTLYITGDEGIVSYTP